MGIQPVGDVDLIRHAYVLPASQGRGVGGALLEHLRGQTTRRILVGTWAAAEWAIRFYRRNGFELVSPERKTTLLQTYWSIPERQIETSVVLADPPFDERTSGALRLARAATRTASNVPMISAFSASAALPVLAPTAPRHGDVPTIRFNVRPLARASAPALRTNRHKVGALPSETRHDLAIRLNRIGAGGG